MKHSIWWAVSCLANAVVWTSGAFAQAPSEWNEPHAPFKVFGDAYYVGTARLGSVLITSKDGHILIDGALPESAPLIVANIKALGFRIEDVKLILNTHVHFDHAGGIAQLQKLSGARVAASAAAAAVLRSGEAGRDDPQFGRLPKIDPIADVRVFKDGETLRVGALAVTAHLSPGHTPGGTSWSWRACEQQACVNIVYADSLNPISADGYLYSDAKRHPNGVEQLESSFKMLDALSCDILLTPHPELAQVFEKLAQRETNKNSFIDPQSCKRYVAASREKLHQRVAGERSPAISAH